MYVYDKDYEYNQIYTNKELSSEDIVNSLISKYNININELTNLEEKIKNIKEETIDLVLYVVPSGSPRPRSGGDHFYVKNASKLRRMMECIVDEENQKLIVTATELTMKFYLPTPGNLSPIHKVLAEKEILKPECKPDFDNLPKGYIDALKNILLLDDNLIHEAHIYKFYSVKPRVEIALKYLTDFSTDFNRERVQKIINRYGGK